MMTPTAEPRMGNLNVCHGAAMHYDIGVGGLQRKRAAVAPTKRLSWGTYRTLKETRITLLTSSLVSNNAGQS